MRGGTQPSARLHHVAGLTQGVGLVMLVPFLELIGLGETKGSEGIATHISGVLGWLGLPVNMTSILCLYVVIVSTHSIVARYREVLNSKIVNGFTQAMRQSLYRALSRAEWLCFLRSKTSDITHVLTVDIQRVGFATQQLLQLIGKIIIVNVYIVVALVLSVPMTVFSLAFGIGFLLLMHPFNRKAQSTGEDLRGSVSNMYAAITEHLGGMKIAKSYNLGNRHQETFRLITNSITDQLVNFAKINTATRMYYEIGAAVALATFFFVAVVLVHIPAANLLLIVFLFARILPGFSMIQQCMQRITNAIPSFGAVLEMKKRFEAAKEPLLEDSIRPFKLNKGISFSNVSFRYDKTRQAWALRNVDLMIPAKTMTAIMGPSGAGKSTMADLILGLLSPDQGTVKIDGKPLSGDFLHRWRQSVGYVPQDTFLFNDTIRANLLWALPNAEDKDLWRVLRLSAADGFVSGAPQGLDAVVGDRGGWLSGGERQRIALARALLREPSLLLLDEATSSLDTESEEYINEAIDRLQGKLTIVVIAHRSATIQRADHTVVLDKGQIVEGVGYGDLKLKTN